jgi:hypothetical protein
MNDKIIPLTPNLAGDNVRFARYVDGKAVTWGHMHRDHIERFRSEGHDIRIVDEDWEPPPPKKPEQRLVMQMEIARTLEQTDKYFTSDAMDNIDTGMQGQWRQYRKALRDAAKKSTPQDVAAALPGADPKGNDPFQKFR